MGWLISRRELSVGQLSAVEASADEPRLIVGAPGSGKTQILLHRAAYLRERYRVPSSRFRIFVFTNVLKEYIRAGCDDLGIPLDCISTFDSWCGDYYRKNISPRLPWNAASRRANFSAIRIAVHDHATKAARPLFDFVLIDEGQDLDGQAFRTLRAVAHHVTVCADYKQQIYETGSDEIEIAAHLGLGRRNMNLLEAYRSSPYVVPLASAFIADTTERVRFERQCRTEAGSRELPLLYVARDVADERRRLADIVRIRLRNGERIAILLPQKRQVFGFARGLREDGLEVEVPARRAGEDKLDFGSDLPKLLTYHSAKGLTFDSVLMPRLVNGSFGQRRLDQVERLLFVGITRAISWVYLSSVQGSELPVLGHLDLLVDLRKLARQHGEAVSQRPDPDPAAEDGISLDDLL